MKLSYLEDISHSEVIKGKYSLAIFASGYESRCRYVSSLLKTENIEAALILGFDTSGNDSSRTQSDIHFERKWHKEPTIVQSSDERHVYKILNEVRDSLKLPLRILVDYSSMSRTWYAAILNWVRYNDFESEVTIDFVYSVGAYSNVLPPIAVESILPLPGCEGSSGTITKSIAIFGLGFENLAPLCVLDKLQPDEIFAYLSSPENRPDYTRIARKTNEELIEAAKETLELPIASIKTCFAKLSEVISPYLLSADITIVPMGPKPHVLSAILLAITFDQVTCLHVHGKQKKIEDIQTTEEVIASRVVFKNKHSS